MTVPKRLAWFAALCMPLSLQIGCGDDGSSDGGSGRDPGPDFFDGRGDLDIFCRENPEDCDGEIGGSCERDSDCDDGVCCTEDKNCAGGMCLYRCDDDRDCPDNQRCEHKQCFFACERDSDCGRGQSCEHGETVCEYP